MKSARAKLTWLESLREGHHVWGAPPRDVSVERRKWSEGGEGVHGRTASDDTSKARLSSNGAERVIVSQLHRSLGLGV